MDPNTLIIFETTIEAANLTVGVGPRRLVDLDGPKIIRLEPGDANQGRAVRFGDLPDWQQAQIKAALATES